jgi:Putative prokaryotic signal transducing protein
MKNQDFVTIAVVYGQIKADILKAHLESEGIPVFLQYESLGRVYGISVDGLGKIKIKVPAERVEDAKQILEQTPDDTKPDEK